MSQQCMAWHINNNTLPFILPVIRHLSPAVVDLVFEGDAIFQNDVSSLRSDGYRIMSYDSSMMDAYDFIITDQYNLLFRDIYVSHAKRGARFLCTQHSTDGFGMTVPNCNYSIRSHKMLARCVYADEVVFLRDDGASVCDALCALPPESREEFAYSGPYHLDSWLERRHDRAQLRSELLAALGGGIDPDKPLLAFFLDEISHEVQLVEGLRELSRHATIVYKAYYKNDPRVVALGDAVIPWPSLEYAPNLLRFGADVVLAGYHSGTLATAVMAGLRVIPFYTRLIHPDGRPGKLSSYRLRIPRERNYDVANNCTLALEHVFDIQDTARIVDAIHSEAHWSDFERRLDCARHIAFGDYCLEEAAGKTAALILRAWQKGTFGPDASAVRIRREWFDENNIGILEG